ncbi:MAG: hypothetical protein Q9164_001922 [Protoblastenia rupestris]
MVDKRSLHERVVDLMPSHERKPKTVMAAIMKAGKSILGELGSEDFLWIKCKSNTRAERIHQQYQTRREEGGHWALTHQGQSIDLGTILADLNTYGDDVVVFEVINASDANRLLPPLATNTSKTSTPLSPKCVNTQIRSTSLKAAPQGDNENAAPSPSPRDLHLSSSTKRPLEHPSNTQLSRKAPSEKVTDNLVTSSQPSQTAQSLTAQSKSNDPASTSAGSRIVDETTAKYDQRTPNEGKYGTPHPSTGTQRVTTTLASKIHVNEPPITAAEIEEQNNKSFQLSIMLKDATPQILEASVDASVELLNSLKAPLLEKMANSPDAEQWIQQIDSLKKQAVKTKTVIGVVGNTGAGKSSVINAMLDEERLVPTNCMRACTAVVTEISYNYEEKPYCAEIEFISPADWERELKVLFQDMLDGDGKVSRECANEDTDAGIAYAKIKAVYPHKTKEDLANSDTQMMLREVSHILGSSRDIKEIDSLMFYRKLQNFVDSKEKSTGKKDKDGKKEKKEREFWPLIRVVRLYVRSPTLATGAVIVDLPGVHDANAARAAVAEGYMKQCTGLWIVAPINRAVDDKAAKSLLGESFKRQLKMDGGFNAVTFICSKTDDISLMEAQDSLGLDDKMGPSWDEVDRLSAKQKSLKKQLEEMKETKTVYEEVANDADEQIEVWESLRESVGDGKVVFAPKPDSATKKRKGSSKEKIMKKRRKTSSSDIEDSDFIDDDIESEDQDDSASDKNFSDDETQERRPLSEQEIEMKLQELKTTKKDSRNLKREITDKMAEMRKEINAAKDAEKEIESQMSALCISGRNEYSKGAIQQDFAAGIKELDQEIAAEEDEESFDPDAEARDYEEVARTLPVFCVSSRGYQKLQGRLRKDPNVPGFTSIEETEIPQLQAHCEKLTETGRAANCRTFINKLSQLLNSLTLWASSDGTGANLTTEQKAREARYLQKGLDGLETGLEKAVETTCRELNDEFDDSIFDRYETAIQNAARDSIETALKWGAPVNRQDRAAGGLYWATYKAICRRDGCFTNANGTHDWNVQLTEPMIKILASGWEKVFARRIQHVMSTFARTAPTGLRKFHRDTEIRVRKAGTGVAGLSMLSQQVGVYEQILKDLAISAKDMANGRQKDINREFVPVIARAMQDAYAICTDEHGSGCFARMKAAMNSHVAHYRQYMFQDSADHVKNLLKDLAKEVEAMMADKIDEVFVQMKRDYRSVLGGGEMPQNGEALPKVQRQVGKEIMRIIEGVEKMMSRVVGIEVQEEPGEDEENDDPTPTQQNELEDKVLAHESEQEGQDIEAVKEEHAHQPHVKREGSPPRLFVPARDQSVATAEGIDEPMDDLASLRSDISIACFNGDSEDSDGTETRVQVDEGQQPTEDKSSEESYFPNKGNDEDSASNSS